MMRMPDIVPGVCEQGGERVLVLEVEVKGKVEVKVEVQVEVQVVIRIRAFTGAPSLTCSACNAHRL